MSQFFQEVYVQIAEATAASRDTLTAAVAPLGDTTDYDGNGLNGNVKTVVDVQTAGEAGDFTETSISETQFEIDNLVPANSTWTQMQDLAVSNTPYNAIVTSLNNFVINNVLGQETTNPGSIGGVYQSTLAEFIAIDCQWYEPSTAEAPQSWIDLSEAAGFTVR